MLRAAVFFALALTVTSGGMAQACGNGKILFQDTFTAPDPSWGLPASDANLKFGSAGLSYKLAPKIGMFSLTERSLYNDYEVCADFTIDPVTQNSSEGGGICGLIFWAADEKNEYLLLYSSTTKSFAIGRKQNGKIIYPVRWTESTTINQASGAKNSLSILVKGSHAVASINGQKVIEFDGEPTDGGTLPGFTLENAITATTPVTNTVANFQVRSVS